MTHEPTITVVICTRERTGSLLGTLDALGRQTSGGFAVLVVDQSPEVDERLAARAHDDARLTVVHDNGRGLSRARNLATRAASTDWLVFLDDDCVPEPEWAAGLAAAFGAAPGIEFVSGHVGPGPGAAAGLPQYAVFAVDEPRTVSGRRAWPHDIGFGVCFAVQRETAMRLGGWDERLGPGVSTFPASDDMDFNFRFLHAGGVAHLTPSARATHEQWRSNDELVALFSGYMASWAGFSVKHVRTTGIAAGLRLWSYGLGDTVRMFLSAARHGSGLRLRIALAKTRGLARGTVAGMRVDWRRNATSFASDDAD
jgi:GT2 family glycosyltransferase